ncbi:uncharacterized protein EV420DRAFT_1759816 [Desarmillaria tabescens]|uniref:Uncharacterized protein n=1 Tax=Armillaria tabescens TaxID=1929756 RepID=A0AA39T4Z8_ARMTA|nr:uncharacterized protein EV420DRAFT_1759816 [Desarmillaria tabescens]KAK0465086.1 hypothetical protein EV420DRAFT_1759816 [Desarmillaria tabescens]
MPGDSVSSLASTVPSHAITERSKNTRTSRQPPIQAYIHWLERSEGARISNCNSTAGSDCRVDDSIGRVKQSKRYYSFTHAEESSDDRQLDNDRLGEKGEILPRRRIFNVKRARKIVQFFGEHPPLELILRDDACPSSIQHLLSSNISTRHPSPENERMSPHSKDRSKNISPDPFDDDHVTFTSAFWVPKRRTAQSSSFFGVTCKDSPPFVPKTAPPMQEQSTRSAQVDVQSTRRRFWGFGKRYTTREVLDIADVIEKLHCLSSVN